MEPDPKVGSPDKESNPKDLDESSEKSRSPGEFLEVVEEVISESENENSEHEETRMDQASDEANGSSGDEYEIISDIATDNDMKTDESESEASDGSGIEENKITVDNKGMKAAKSEKDPLEITVDSCDMEKHEITEDKKGIETEEIVQKALETTVQSSDIDKDQHCNKNLLKNEEMLDNFLDSHERSNIEPEPQCKIGNETNADLQECHITEKVVSPKINADTTVSKTTSKEMDCPPVRRGQSEFGLHCEWLQISYRGHSEEFLLLQKKRHKFIEIVTLFDKPLKYFEMACKYVRTDPGIMNSLPFLHKLICQPTNNPDIHVKSLALLQALLLNPNCDLSFRWLNNFIEFLLSCLTKNAFPDIHYASSHMIALLIAEITKGQDMEHQALYFGVVSFIERMLLFEPSTDIVICSSLIDCLVSMGYVAVGLIMPKIFPKMCKKVDAYLDLLSATKGNRCTSFLLGQDSIRQDSICQDSIQELNEKVLHVTRALRLHGKLLDACELLMKHFFLENFMHSSVSKALKFDESKFCDADNRLFKLQQKNLKPLFQNCIKYFGEALTSRLSLICTPNNVIRFRRELHRDVIIHVYNNTFMNTNLLLRTLTNKKRKAETARSSKNSLTKGQKLLDANQIKTAFCETRGGLIDMSEKFGVMETNNFHQILQKCFHDNFKMNPSEGLSSSSKSSGRQELHGQNTLVAFLRTASDNSKRKAGEELNLERKRLKILGSSTGSDVSVKEDGQAIPSDLNLKQDEKDPRVFRISVKEFLDYHPSAETRVRAVSEIVRKSTGISGGPNPNVGEQAETAFPESVMPSGSKSSREIPASSHENPYLDRNKNSNAKGTGIEPHYLKYLKEPPNLPTLWLDKLSTIYKKGPKARPLQWKATGNLDIFL